MENGKPTNNSAEKVTQRPPSPNYQKQLEVEARVPAHTKDGPLAVVWLVLVIIAIVAANAAIDESKAIPVGTRCSILQATYGVKDLGHSYIDLDKARKAHDAFGLAELAQRDVAVLLPAETSCLVIDTDFFEHFTFYRQVRILSDPYVGKAVWIKKSALVAVASNRP